MPHAYFLGGNGGAKRRSCRPDGGARTTGRTNRHSVPSPCRTPSVRPPASDCRPQGGHPCIERTRDAQGRSNVLRPLQRRFKARKKPEGYTSTPAGLKRLKTQNTASYFSVSSSPMSPKWRNASRIASRFSGGHFGCFLSPDLSACVSSPHSAFICATYRELTFMPCVFWT